MSVKSRPGPKLGIVGSKSRSKDQLLEKHVISLVDTVWTQSSRNYVKMFVIIYS